MASVPAEGLLWILAGGIAYTIGAGLYALGVKHRYMHSVFHIFVVAGSILQFFGIFFYVI
jgi:hemolysin III